MKRATKNTLISTYFANRKHKKESTVGMWTEVIPILFYIFDMSELWCSEDFAV